MIVLVLLGFILLFIIIVVIAKGSGGRNPGLELKTRAAYERAARERGAENMLSYEEIAENVTMARKRGNFRALLMMLLFLFSGILTVVMTPFAESSASGSGIGTITLIIALVTTVFFLLFLIFAIFKPGTKKLIENAIARHPLDG